MSQLREGTADPQRLRKETNELPSVSIRENGKKKQSSFEKIILLAIVFTFIFACIGLLILYNKNIQHVNEAFRSDTVPTSSTNTEGETALKTYTNEMYGFSFKYPSDWKISEEEGKGGQNNDIDFNAITLQKNEYILNIDYFERIEGGMSSLLSEEVKLTNDQGDTIYRYKESQNKYAYVNDVFSNGKGLQSYGFYNLGNNYLNIILEVPDSSQVVEMNEILQISDEIVTSIKKIP